MNLLTNRIKNCWCSHDLDIQSGTSASSIEQFEANHNVHIPSDLRDYLLEINGMVDRKWDSEMIWFFSLDRFTLLLDELVKPEDSDQRVSYDAPQHPEQYFIFADYLIASHYYAIRLTSESAEVNPVIWFYSNPSIGTEHYQMAGSFGEFMEKYLADPSSILFPPDDTVGQSNSSKTTER